MRKNMNHQQVYLQGNQFFFTDIYAHMYYIFSKTSTEKWGEERVMNLTK